MIEACKLIHHNNFCSHNLCLLLQEHANESGLDTSTHHHVQSLKSERDQYSDDLQQVEKSFTELHRRYDKLRESIQHHKRNEDKMKEELVDLRKQLRDSHLNFEVYIYIIYIYSFSQFEVNSAMCIHF